MRYLVSAIIYSLIFLSLAASAQAEAGNVPLLLGVHPYLPVAEIQTRFTPLANYLAQEIGRPALQTQLRLVLLKLKDTAEGKAIMAAIHPGMTALVAANDADYDNLRSLMGLTKPAAALNKHGD